MVLRAPHVPALLHERPIARRAHANGIAEGLRRPRFRRAVLGEHARLRVLGLVFVLLQQPLDLQADLGAAVVDGDGVVGFAGEGEVEEGGAVFGGSGGGGCGGFLGRDVGGARG